MNTPTTSSDPKSRGKFKLFAFLFVFAVLFFLYAVSNSPTEDQGPSVPAYQP